MNESDVGDQRREEKTAGEELKRFQTLAEREDNIYLCLRFKNYVENYSL